MEMDNLETAQLIKEVYPKGDILNDGSTNVDRLGHVIYATALNRQIQKIKTPVTVGIFAPWGSGKSFLLQHVQCLAANEQERYIKLESNKKKKRKKRKTKSLKWLCPAFVLFLLILFGSLTFVFNKVHKVAALFIIFLILLLLLLLLLLVIVVSLGEHCFDCGWTRYIWVLLSAMYTKLPIGQEEIPTVQTTIQEKIILKKKKSVELPKTQSSTNKAKSEEQNSTESSRRFIFVNFNAWECAGCDKLWAGIVTALAKKVEEEFGVFTTRIFRTLSLDTIPKDQHLLDSCKLYVKVNKCSEEKLCELMKIYGEITSCKVMDERISTEQPANIENEFEVCYSTSREARIALKALKHLHLDVELLAESNSSQTSFQNNGFEMWEQLIKRPRRSCFIPNWIWCCLFALACILVPVVTVLSIHTTEHFEQSGHDEDEPDDVGEIVGQVFSFLPLGASLLAILFKLTWAIFNSQNRRILRALKGVKADVKDELGFMYKIKEEVQAISNLIHTVEFTSKIEFKVIIMIDDLDRVPLPKVKAVLEAVNVLLSERCSPFICLIAIDSRVAVKCFEVEVEDGMQGGKGIINGLEYLKKIINVPFCLPEIDFDSKTYYIAGLIDEADDTEHHLEQLCHPTKDLNHDEQLQMKEVQQNGTLDEQKGHDKPDYPREGLQLRFPRVKQTPSKPKKDQEEEEALVEYQSLQSQPKFDRFLFECRKYMYEDKILKHHLHGNPRNIKRIFNVISITASVMQCLQQRKTCCKSWSDLAKEIHNPPGTGAPQAESSHARENETSKQKIMLKAKDVVLWIVLTDQWPFSMSCLIQMIEDSDQRTEAGRAGEEIKNKSTLFEIYKMTRIKIIRLSESIQYLNTLDYDPDLLYSLLLKNPDLTKHKVKELLKYSINLDRNLRREISFETDRMDQYQPSHKTEVGSSNKRIEGHTTPPSKTTSVRSYSSTSTPVASTSVDALNFGITEIDSLRSCLPANDSSSSNQTEADSPPSICTAEESSAHDPLLPQKSGGSVLESFTPTTSPKKRMLGP